MTCSLADRDRQPTRWLRIGIPVLLVLVWLVGGSVGGPYFGKVDEVSTNDQSSFLPESADATQVSERLPDFLGDDSIPAVVVVTGDGALTDDELAAICRPSRDDIAEHRRCAGRRLAADRVRGRRGGADLRADRRVGRGRAPIVEEIRTLVADGAARRPRGLGDRAGRLHRRPRRGLPRHRRTAARRRAASRSSSSS